MGILKGDEEYQYALKTAAAVDTVLEVNVIDAEEDRMGFSIYDRVHPELLFAPKSSAVPRLYKTVECKYWRAPGGCRQGGSCHFRHDAVAEAKLLAAQVVAPTFDGAPYRGRCTLCNRQFNSYSQEQAHISGNLHKFQAARDAVNTAVKQTVWWNGACFNCHSLYHQMKGCPMVCRVFANTGTCKFSRSCCLEHWNERGKVLV